MTGDHDRDGGEGVPQEERDDRPEIDIDTAFAAIVAGLREQPSVDVGRWPAAEDLPDDDPDGDGRDGGHDDTDETSQPVSAPVGAGGTMFAPQGEVISDDEGYVPPEPPPLPRGDTVSRLAWAGVLGGPLFLLIAAIVWQELPKTLLLGALAAFVGGFVTLVARMPSDPPDEPDDGAVV